MVRIIGGGLRGLQLLVGGRVEEFSSSQFI